MAASSKHGENKRNSASKAARKTRHLAQRRGGIRSESSGENNSEGGRHLKTAKASGSAINGASLARAAHIKRQNGGERKMARLR